jgi:hypothetical protein
VNIGKNYDLERTGDPSSLMKKERKLHNEEIENQGYFEKLVEEFRVNSILPDDSVGAGWLRSFANDQSGTEGFVSLAENESQKSLDGQCLVLSG